MGNPFSKSENYKIFEKDIKNLEKELKLVKKSKTASSQKFQKTYTDIENSIKTWGLSNPEKKKLNDKLNNLKNNYPHLFCFEKNNMNRHDSYNLRQIPKKNYTEDKFEQTNKNKFETMCPTKTTNFENLSINEEGKTEITDRDTEGFKKHLVSSPLNSPRVEYKSEQAVYLTIKDETRSKIPIKKNGILNVSFSKDEAYRTEKEKFGSRTYNNSRKTLPDKLKPEELMNQENKRKRSTDSTENGRLESPLKNIRTPDRRYNQQESVNSASPQIRKVYPQNRQPGRSKIAANFSYQQTETCRSFSFKEDPTQQDNDHNALQISENYLKDRVVRNRNYHTKITNQQFTQNENLYKNNIHASSTNEVFSNQHNDNSGLSSKGHLQTNELKRNDFAANNEQIPANRSYNDFSASSGEEFCGRQNNINLVLSSSSKDHLQTSKLGQNDVFEKIPHQFSSNKSSWDDNRSTASSQQALSSQTNKKYDLLQHDPDLQTSQSKTDKVTLSSNNANNKKEIATNRSSWNDNFPALSGEKPRESSVLSSSSSAYIQTSKTKVSLLNIHQLEPSSKNLLPASSSKDAFPTQNNENFGLSQLNKDDLQTNKPNRNESASYINSGYFVANRGSRYNFHVLSGEETRGRQNNEHLVVSSSKNHLQTSTSRENDFSEYIHQQFPSNDNVYDFSSNSLVVRKAETPIQETVPVSNHSEEILDVHQFFSNDLDWKSLESMSDKEKIITIEKHAKQFESKVGQFQDEQYSLEYFILDEKLMRLIEKLDKIKCHTDKELTTEKVTVIKYINHLHSVLDKRALENTN